ncbi:hypothetical protein ASPZODRAFT_137378 [Penicilliopsis zonata CBS 506.65]|uniref:Uncharacterized protein n=1 Tax=Penicilliopsis zonata CBS 506.65 TaxID=1073090 RepID=A0A1L9S559_9EURO|nr:hypothetical protein ASPZODRAFT_137378 [Penicilliopsis zonata CBS 506.65]OJJ42295.1 hypothetical protein ASPZODRAFT_137378 [Penicilliopsis zonata CBS 506.65]
MTLTAADVTFDPENMFLSKRKKRNAIIADVVNSAPSWAVNAKVVNGPHTSRSDRRNHITVDYIAPDGSFSRMHVLPSP